MAGLDVSDATRWQLPATAALLERSVLARRLHNGPLQDIAAAMLHLQIQADRADEACRPAFEHAIGILVEQQRAIRLMVERMLEGDGETPVAVILEALAMQRRGLGQKLTWKVIPSDLTLRAGSDLSFRLKLLESLSSLGRETESASVLVELPQSGLLNVSISGEEARTVSYSMDIAELRA